MKFILLLVTITLVLAQCKPKEKTEVEKAHSNSAYKSMTNDETPVSNFKLGRMDDAEMDKAVEKAKEELDTFISSLKNKKKNQKLFTLKVKIQDGDNAEHLWIADVKFVDGKFKGVLNNQPFMIRSVKMGDEVTAEKEDITDWMFVEDGKMVGGYTSRVLINRMSKEQRKRFLEQVEFKIE